MNMGLKRRYDAKLGKKFAMFMKRAELKRAKIGTIK
jgi:hypothetical protein